MKNYTGHWKTSETPDPETHIGFIYCITNLTNGRKYIGKKFYWRYRKYRRKGYKNSRITRYDSGWATYKGSSKELLADIRRLGKKKFEFTILHQWKSKSALRYAEIEEQVSRDALRKKLPGGEYEYYNKHIEACKGRPIDERGK